MATKKKSPVPAGHHIDKRADMIIAAAGGDDDALLDSVQLAALLGMSRQWVEISRPAGYGPPYIKVGVRSIRYRKSDVMKWLDQRARASMRKRAAA